MKNKGTFSCLFLRKE